MAHHQGMTIVAIANAVLGARMRTRFHAEPMVQARELLLQERAPRDVAVSHPWAAETKSAVRKGRDVEPLGGRRFSSAHRRARRRICSPTGAIQDAYHRRRRLQPLGAARRDPLARRRTWDDWGSYIFLRDVHTTRSGRRGFSREGREPHDYRVSFNEDRAEFIRQDGTLTTSLEVLVSSEDDAEVGASR